jgi:hypothetical protein
MVSSLIAWTTYQDSASENKLTWQWWIAPMVLVIQDSDQDDHGWMTVQANTTEDHISEIYKAKQG